MASVISRLTVFGRTGLFEWSDTDDSDEELWLCRDPKQREAREVCRTVYAVAYHICSFKTKRLPRRLRNKPYSEEMRKIDFRAAVHQYCGTLYRAVRPKVESKERRRNKVAEFAAFAKNLERRVVRDTEIRIPIVGVSGTKRVAVYPADMLPNYAQFHRDVRDLFGKPTHATSVSMQLIDKHGNTVCSRSDFKVNRNMRGRLLKCVFHL